MVVRERDATRFVDGVEGVNVRVLEVSQGGRGCELEDALSANGDTA